MYFPALLDNDAEFNATQDPSRTSAHKVDEDLRAVTNLFDQLVWYGEDTFKETGIRPQIIVTDHADKLTLPSQVEFESLIRKRWRKPGEGFISAGPRDAAIA